MSCHVILYNVFHVLLYNICYVMLCYIKFVMLCYIACHVMLYYITCVMFCYITCVMFCYMTCVMFCYKAFAMLCSMTCVSRSLILWISVFSIVTFGRLRTSSEDFGNRRKWSCRLQKSQNSQDKSLTLITQKTLAGICYIACLMSCYITFSCHVI